MSIDNYLIDLAKSTATDVSTDITSDLTPKIEPVEDSVFSKVGLLQERTQQKLADLGNKSATIDPSKFNPMQTSVQSMTVTDADTVKLGGTGAMRVLNTNAYETTKQDKWFEEPRNVLRMEKQRNELAGELGVPATQVTNEMVFKVGEQQKQNVQNTMQGTVKDSNGQLLPSLVSADVATNRTGLAEPTNNYGRDLGAVTKLGGMYSTIDAADNITDERNAAVKLGDTPSTAQTTKTQKSEAAGTLGSISKKYESRGDVATVVPDTNNTTSYGVYQLNSAGTVQNFLQSPEGVKFGKQLAGYEVGTPDFNNRYKKLATNFGPALEQAQEQYIKRTHFEPLNQKAQEFGVDTSDKRVQEALWSQSVQHSPAGNEKILQSAIGKLNKQSTSDDLIRALYESRIDYTQGLTTLDAKTKAQLADRYANEYVDVLNTTPASAENKSKSTVENAAKAFAYTLGEGIANTADLVPEVVSYVYGNIIGDKKWSDTKGLYDSEENKAYKEWLGYNDTVVNVLGEKAAVAAKDAWENGDYEALLNVMGDALTTPELLTTSLGYVAGMILPGAAANKALQLTSKVNKTANAIKASDATGKMTKAEALAIAEKEAGTSYDILKTMTSNVGFAGEAEQFSRDAEALYKETYNEEMPTEQKLLIRPLGMLFAKTDALTAKAILMGKDPIAKAVPQMIKALPEAIKVNFAGKMAVIAGSTAVKAAGAFGLEGSTEAIQTAMEKVAGKYKQGEIGIGDVLEQDKYEIAGSGLLGGVGGNQMQVAGAVPRIIVGTPGAVKKGIELATETPLQKDLRQLREYSNPLQDEALTAAVIGDYQTVADRVEQVHGKLADELDPSAAKGRTYATVLNKAMNKALVDGDGVALDNVYKTMKELHNNKNVEFNIKDVVHKDASQIAQEFVRLINSNTKDTEDVAAAFRGEVGKEADKQASIIEAVEGLRKIAEIKEKKLRSVMGTDLEDSVYAEITELQETIKEYLGGKGLEDTNKEIAKLGFLVADPENGLVSDPSRPGLAVYEEALTEQLLNPKTNKSLLADELIGTAGAAVDGGSRVRLQGLTEFAKSRVDKLNPIRKKQEATYQTQALMGNMLNENEQMTKVIDNVLATTNGLTGLDEAIKQSYVDELTTAKSYVENAKEQLNRRNTILDTVTKPEGMKGALAFKTDRAGNETIQVMIKEDGKWKYTKIAKVVDGKAVMLDKYTEIKTKPAAQPDEVMTKDKFKEEYVQQVKKIIKDKAGRPEELTQEEEQLLANAAEDGVLQQANKELADEISDVPTTKVMQNDSIVDKTPNKEDMEYEASQKMEKATEEVVSNKTNESVKVAEVKTKPTAETAKQWLEKKFAEKFDNVNSSAMNNKTLENVLAITSKSILVDIAEELGNEPKATISAYRKLLLEIVKDKLEAKKEPLKKMREHIEKTEGALKDAISGVDDMNMKVALRNYYKAELGKLRIENGAIRKLIDTLESNKNTMERDKLLGRFKSMITAILEGIDKIMSMLMKHNIELESVKKLQRELQNEYTSVMKYIDNIESNYLHKIGVTSTEVKTSVGTVKQYADSVYGPMVELNGKRVDARRTITKKMNGIESSQEVALKRATEEIVLERTKELRKEGSLGAELLANNIEKFGLTSPIVRVLKLGTESVFGRLGVDMFNDTAKLIENLPTKFKEVFANQDESKEELVKNIETMAEYIKNVQMNDIAIDLNNRIQIEGKNRNVSYSGLAIKYAEKYENVVRTDIAIGDTIAIGKEKGYKVTAVTSEGTIVATKTTYDKDTRSTAIDKKELIIEDKTKLQKLNVLDSTFSVELLELLGKLDEAIVIKEINGVPREFSKLNISPKIETLVKFYTSKLIADTQAMIGLILSMDQSEMGKKLGIQDAEEQAAMYAMAQEGKVLSASVRANIGNDLYKALGIKFDSSTPEFTVESFKAALGALVQAVAVDSGVMETESVIYDNTSHNTLRVNHDKVQSLLGKDKITSDLTKSINKLQYITESTKRPLLSKEKPTDRTNRMVMNTDVPLTDAENVALNKLDKVPLVLDAPRIEEYITMEKANKEAFGKALGLVDVANKHKDNRGAILAQNDKTMREWDLLKSAYYATNNGTENFYVEWGKTVSDRVTVLNDIQYQESKLHRELVHATDQIADIKLDNADVVLMMKAAISNGLDMDPDKLSIETMVNNFDAMVKVDDNGVAIQIAEKNGKKNPLHVAIDTMFKAMTGNNATEWFNESGVAEAMGEIFHESEGHHGHSAVKLLADWHKAIINKLKTFKTKMQLEADAITSGMMITLLQIGTDKAMDMLEKGGFYRKYKDANGNWIDRAAELEEYVKTWLGNDITFNAGALIEAGKKHASILEDNATVESQKAAMKKYFTELGHTEIDAKIEAQSLDITSDSVFKDLYSTIGVAMLEDVKNYKRELEALEFTDKFTVSQGEQLALFRQIGELNLKNIRSIAKSPVMVYVYGASINSIKKKLGYELGLKPLLNAIEELSSLYKKSENGIVLNNDEETKIEQLNSFIDQFVKTKEYRNEYGKKINVTNMSDSEKLLYLNISTKVINDLQKNVDKMFSTPIEKAFDDRFGFMNDNRDAMKTLEIIAFEAYMLRLSDDVVKLLSSYSKNSKGEMFELSQDQMTDLNAKLTAMGYGHAVAWDHGDRIDYQSMNKTGKVGTAHSTTVRVGDSEPVSAGIKQWKPEVNTGAMATIPIHAIDGRFIMEVLTKLISNPKNKELLAGTSKNIYDALAMALSMEMLKRDSGTYNTTAVTTGFERSIMADQLAMVEGMLYTRNADGSIGAVDEEFLAKLAKNIGLDPKGSGRLSYIKEALRLGLGTGRMIEALDIAEKANIERLENSKLKFESNHMHQGPITPTTIDAVKESRAKPFGPFNMLKKLLNDKFEADKAQVQKEFKEKKVILDSDTNYVFGINDLFNYGNAVDSIGNILKIKGVKVENGKDKVELADNGKLYQLLGGQDQVEIRSKGLTVYSNGKTKKLAFGEEVLTGSQEYWLRETLKMLAKKGVKVVMNKELKEQLIDTGMWQESEKIAKAEAKVEKGTLSEEQITKLKEIFMKDNVLKSGIAKLAKELKLDMKGC